MSGCPYCNNGWLGNRYGEDVECINGVLIDVDVFHEGWQRDVSYPPAPCQACVKCRGSGERGRGECRTCKGTGWKSGQDESQERLADRASDGCIAEAEEIDRLRRIEAAARNVAETLNGGFLVCSRCGEQESTTQLDYARELYEALDIEMSRR